MFGQTNCSGVVLIDDVFFGQDYYNFYLGSVDYFEVYDFYSNEIYIPLSFTYNEDECSYIFQEPIEIGDYVNINLNLYFPELQCTTAYHLWGQYQSLAIELIEFNVVNNENSNQISWKTASAVDEAYFVLEHSTDGTQFKEIYFCETENHTSGIKDYYFEHRSNIEKNYYRLCCIDVNGHKRVISDIKESSNTVSNFSVYPTITSDYIYIVGSKNEIQTIFDSKYQKLKLNFENNAIDFSSFPAGLYFIKTSNKTHKIIKK